MFHGKRGPILYHFHDKARYCSIIAIFAYLTWIRRPRYGGSLSEYFHNVRYGKNLNGVATDGFCKQICVIIFVCLLVTRKETSTSSFRKFGTSRCAAKMTQGVRHLSDACVSVRSCLTTSSHKHQHICDEAVRQTVYAMARNLPCQWKKNSWQCALIAKSCYTQQMRGIYVGVCAMR